MSIMKKNMSVILFSEYNLDQIQFHSPTKNRQQTGLSARAIDHTKIQFGSAEKPCCIVEEIVKSGRHCAVRLAVTSDFISWYHQLESALVDRVVEKCDTWFRYAYDRPTVQRMLHSLLTNRSEMVVRCQPMVNCFKEEKKKATHEHGNDLDLVQIDFAEISEGDIVIPIVRFEGIFIGEKHFTPSFVISDILVLGREQKKEELHPFIKLPTEQQEEIIDPFSYYSRNNDTHSCGSFDTHVFTQ